jgi:hypothetical protein
LENWARDGDYGTYTRIWFENYIEGAGIQPGDLKTIRVDGHHLTFSYSDLRDVLYIRSNLVDDKLPAESIELAVHGIRSRIYRVEAEINAMGMSIDISPHEDEYGIICDIFDNYISDGPKHINQPDQDVTSLLVEGGWMISSPSIELALWDVPGPYVLADEDNVEENITISFVMAGTQITEPRDVLKQVQETVSPPTRAGESQVSIILNQLAEIAIQNNIWFGVRTTSTGDDEAHPLSRTFLLDIDGGTVSDDPDLRMKTWQLLSASGRINSLVRDMIWGASVNTEMQTMTTVRSILLEEVPSWTASGSLIGETDMMFLTHTISQIGFSGHENLQTLNIASISKNDPSRYHNKADGWELSTYEGLSILW